MGGAGAEPPRWRTAALSILAGGTLRHATKAIATFARRLAPLPCTWLQPQRHSLASGSGRWPLAACSSACF
jgi:hypothetical protein